MYSRTKALINYNERNTKLSEKTISADEKRIERINDRFGCFYVDEITTKMVDLFITDL